MKNRKCKTCNQPFQIALEGRVTYYAHRYCSEACRKESVKKQNELRNEQNRIKSVEKVKKYKELKGKILRNCKNCKKEYSTYASHLKHRGSSFCSRECSKIGRKSNRSIPRLKTLLWNDFSRFIRLRDALKTTGDVRFVKCITCGDTRQTLEVDAGHFYSCTHSSIRFDEHNVHAQCKKCNMPPNSGEQYKYSQVLTQIYGKEEVERLGNERHKIRKFTKQELEGLIEEYQRKVKDIISINGTPWATK